jgi:methylated-DNA-[protein]-cysteine S-methyltransferase
LERLKLSTEEYGNTCFGCLVDDQDRLVSSAFGSSSKIVRAHLTNYSKSIGGKPVLTPHPITHEMISLYKGDNVSKSIHFNTDHVSKFQRQVYKVLERIPKGKVTTYGLISKHLASAPRAVGGAVASNPWPLFIPCERVVNFDLTVGNYGMCGSLGPRGTINKRALLEREKVPILKERIDKKAVWDPSRKSR